MPVNPQEKPKYFNFEKWKWYDYLFFVLGIGIISGPIHALYIYYKRTQWDDEREHQQAVPYQEEIAHPPKEKKSSPSDEKLEDDEITQIRIILNNPEPSDLKKYVQDAIDHKKKFIDDGGKITDSKIDKPNLTKQLTAASEADLYTAIEILKSRFGFLLNQEQLIQIFRAHEKLREQLLLYRTNDHDPAFEWIYNYNHTWLPPEEQKSTTTAVTKILGPIDLYGDLSDKEDPSVYTAYVQAVARRQETQAPLEEEKAKIITRNLFIAVLNSLDAAKLFFKNKLEGVFKSFFIPLRLKNIFQRHRKEFLKEKEESLESDKKEEALDMKTHDKTLEELKKCNHQYAKNTYQAIIADPSWKPTSADNDEMKLFFDYLQISSDNNNEIKAIICDDTEFTEQKGIFRICKALEDAMINDVSIAKYILSDPKSKALFDDGETIAEVLKVHYRELILKPDKSLSQFKELHKANITRFVKSNPVIFMGWSKPTEDEKKPTSIEVDHKLNLDHALLSKQSAISYLLCLLTQDKNASYKESIYLVLNAFREIYIMPPGSNAQLSLIRERYDHEIQNLHNENLKYFEETKPTKLESYIDMEYYLRLALDYRKHDLLLKKLQTSEFKDQFKLNLLKIALKHLDFAILILDSSLQFLIKDDTQSIIDRYPIFKNNQHTENEAILRIRVQYIKYIQDKKNATRELPTKSSTSSVTPIPASLSLSDKKESEKKESKQPCTVYLATGTYDPPQPGHLIPHLEYIYRTWLIDCKLNPTCPPPFPTIYFSPSNESYQQGKRNDGRLGFSVDARRRILRRLIKNIQEAYPDTYGQIKIDVYEWESSCKEFFDHHQVYKQFIIDKQLEGRKVIYLPGQDLYDKCCQNNPSHHHMHIEPIPRNDPNKSSGVTHGTGAAALASLSSTRIIAKTNELTNAELLELAPLNYINILREEIKEEDVSVPKSLRDTVHGKFIALDERLRDAESTTKKLVKGEQEDKEKKKEDKKETKEEKNNSTQFKNEVLDQFSRYFGLEDIYLGHGNLLQWLFGDQYKDKSARQMSDEKFDAFCKEKIKRKQEEFRELPFATRHTTSRIQVIQEYLGSMKNRNQYLDYLADYQKIMGDLKKLGVTDLFNFLNFKFESLDTLALTFQDIKKIFMDALQRKKTSHGGFLSSSTEGQKIKLVEQIINDDCFLDRYYYIALTQSFQKGPTLQPASTGSLGQTASTSMYYPHGS